MRNNTAFIFFVVWLLVVKTASAQELSQSVRGRITDEISGQPVSPAAVKVEGQGQIFQANADANGNFMLSVPAGRYRISVISSGYTPIDQELLVISGREAVVNVLLRQNVRELQEVEVSSAYLSEEIPGQHVLSIEKTLRIPANFFDPVRVATAYPGVVAASDQANSIIVRGNSPNGLLWRLNGLDIVNPNHLANAGTLSDKPSSNGGGVNILSAQMLDRTNFYTGTVPANFGNTLSGIIDMKLRDGNRSKHEYTAQASLIGLDFSAEGPMGKNQNTSFLANYRYSTVGLLSLMGIDFGDEAISFQDLSLNISSNFKNGATLTWFGFAGNSKNDFNAKEPDAWEEDKDRYDIFYSSGNYGVGVNYTVPLHRGKFFAGAAYSGSHQERDATVSSQVEPTGNYLLSDDYKTDNTLLSVNLGYETFLGQEGAMEIGMMTNVVDNTISFTKETGCLGCADITTDQLTGANTGILLQPYTNFSYSFSKAMQVKVGARYLQYTFNNTGSFEPRMSYTIKPSQRETVDLSYSLISQIQLPQIYAGAGNSDLGLTRSHHFDLAYNRIFADGLNMKVGVFYQSLFDVPVEVSPSTFSALNLLEGSAPGHLVNEGTGENAGADITLEKYFYNKNYFLVGGSYYESKYTGSDGIKRNTRFNGNYTLSAIYGKEWTKTEKNRTIGINSRLLYLGGLRQTPVDVSASEGSAETVYNNADPFSEKLSDYFRIDLRVSFRKDKPKYTRTFAVDIQNLTSQQNEAYQYYDFTQQKLVTKFQLGIIPVLVYRIDF